MTRTAGVGRGALAPARPVPGSCADKSVQPPIPRIAANPTVERTEKRRTIRPPAWAFAALKTHLAKRAESSAQAPLLLAYARQAPRGNFCSHERPEQTQRLRYGQMPDGEPMTICF